MKIQVRWLNRYTKTVLSAVDLLLHMPGGMAVLRRTPLKLPRPISASMVIQSNLIKTTWQTLEDSVIYYQGEPVGTVAAQDSKAAALNYDQCFTRDFAVSALIFLIKGKVEIVRNFLRETLALQSQEEQLAWYQPGHGLIPASFKVNLKKNGQEYLVPDFGKQAIARVAPVDSCFWWLLILRAYVKATNETKFAHQAQFQQGIRSILDLCFKAGFEMSPTILVPDGSFMIDRRMGVHGHPLEIQVLFYAALWSAKELLESKAENASYHQAITERLSHLKYHLQEYYWLNLDSLNQIYHYQVEAYGGSTLNEFNIYPATIPEWLPTWLPDNGGYFAGNLGPEWIDFRFFAQGNLIAILTSLATQQQAEAIMNLIEHRWEDLVGQMPMKICFPALSGQDWQTITGSDPKNTPWSYHNGGNWPVLIWLLVAAAQKTGRLELASRALSIVEKRLPKDQWREYYDSKEGCLIGKQARKLQTWSIAGFLVAKELLENPKYLSLVTFDQEPEPIACQISPSGQVS